MKRLAIFALLLALTGCSGTGETSLGQGVVVTGEGADTSVTVCALTLDGEGRIAAVRWDTAESDGAVSKKQQGDQYGMKGASPIGREWHEQVAALEEYAVGKTPAELAAMTLTDRGAPAAEELTSSCTIACGAFFDSLEAAAKNAK